MKVCKDCKASKDESDFYGVQNECKECTKKRVKRNSKRVGNLYEVSENGVFRVMYKTQKRHQKLRGHGEMPYTKQELIAWCKCNGFDELFSSWVESGHLKNLKPSVDRLDDFKGYSFENIKLGTWQQNIEHQRIDIKNGVGTSGARCKAVLKINAAGSVVCEYVSYNSASRDVGYSVEYSIKNHTKCKNGFFWRYK